MKTFQRLNQRKHIAKLKQAIQNDDSQTEEEKEKLLNSMEILPFLLKYLPTCQKILNRKK